MELDYLSVDISFGKWEVLGISKNHLTKIKLVADAPKEAFMELHPRNVARRLRSMGA